MALSFPLTFGGGSGTVTSASIIAALGYTPAPLGTYRAFDADAVAWFNAVVANGGTVSLNRLIVVDQFIFSEKTAGLWALTDDYLGFWAENSIQARTSLKQHRLATAINSPTFTPDRDFTFNGATSYLDTGHVPSSHAVAMGVSSAHIESYERTNLAVNGSPFGVQGASSSQLNVWPRNASNGVTVSVMGGIATYTLASVTSLGLTQSGRNGATNTSHYSAKNGVDLTKTADYSALGSALPSHSLFVGACNALGVYSQGRAASVGYVAWGAALDSTQRLARFTNVQAWATAVGAQV